MIIEMQLIDETWEARQVGSILFEDDISYYDVTNNILYLDPTHDKHEVVAFLRHMGFTNVSADDSWGAE